MKTVYLWLCCEGWQRFGPYEWLRFDESGAILDQDGTVVAEPEHCGNAWRTIDSHRGYIWVNPTITSSPLHPHPMCGAHPHSPRKPRSPGRPAFSSGNPASDRVYAIDYPRGFRRACLGIVRTCRRFYIFGETERTPDYDLAAGRFVIPDARQRREAVLACVRKLLVELPSSARLSVYTRDPELVESVNATVTADAIRRLAWFGMFRIARRAPPLWQEESLVRSRS